jgi:hypothetical protein
MEQSPSWEAKKSSSILEISLKFWNRGFHYRIHKRPPLVPHPKPDQCSSYHQIHCLIIHFNIILHLLLGSVSALFPSGFRSKAVIQTTVQLLQTCVQGNYEIRDRLHRLVLYVLWRSGGLAWSRAPESYAGDSEADGSVFRVGQVKGDDPEEKGYPGPPGWSLGVRLTTSPGKKYLHRENLEGASNGT